MSYVITAIVSMIFGAGLALLVRSSGNAEAEQEAYGLGYLNGKEAAMRSPWIKTSDRAPTMEDADAWDLVFATHRAFGGEPYKVRYQVVANNPSDHVWWMPIPPLPEVDNQ